MDSIEAPTTPRRSTRSDNVRFEDASVLGDLRGRRIEPNSTVDDTSGNKRDEDNRTDGAFSERYTGGPCRLLYAPLQALLAISSSPLASYLIILCNQVRACCHGCHGGVRDVVLRKVYCSFTGLGSVSSAGAFGVSLRALCGLKWNKLVADHTAVTFLLVDALCLTGLHREARCSLPTASTPLRFSRSTSSR